MSEDILSKDDPFNDPLWKVADMAALAPSRPGKNYITCPLMWLNRVRPLVHSADQLMVLMVLYRRCLMGRSRTVTLPNVELAALGISRQTKYRLLAWLQEAGAAAVEMSNGRAPRVTLHWFP
jgi:hypothetical protein